LVPKYLFIIGTNVIAIFNVSGAMISGLTTAEVIANLVAGIVFSFVYSATLSIYEGLVLFLGGFTFAICIPLIM
jgi:hypothetical protein